MKYNHSNKISAFEAKTHFSNLLQRVGEGEKITILKHNIPVALLIPIPSNQKSDIQEILKNMDLFRKGKKIGGVSLNELKNEGRK